MKRSNINNAGNIVVGRTVDWKGGPIGRATVQLKQGRRVINEVQSDTNGLFLFEHVPQGVAEMLAYENQLEGHPGRFGVTDLDLSGSRFVQLILC